MQRLAHPLTGIVTDQQPHSQGLSPHLLTLEGVREERLGPVWLVLLTILKNFEAKEHKFLCGKENFNNNNPLILRL